jgi:hypothetical protein
MIFWSADYLETVLGMQKASAAQAISLFLAGMILGRLAASRLLQRFSISLVINTSILIAGVGFLFFWQAGSAAVGLAGLFLTGLGVASLYPLILSLAIEARPVAMPSRPAPRHLASARPSWRCRCCSDGQRIPSASPPPTTWCWPCSGRFLDHPPLPANARRHSYKTVCMTAGKLEFYVSNAASPLKAVLLASGKDLTDPATPSCSRSTTAWSSTACCAPRAARLRPTCISWSASVS